MGRKMICRTSDVPANGLKECEGEGGIKLLVANSGSEYFAVQALCPHQDVPLCEGLYDGSVLICHQHLWQWDIRTGAPMGLAEAPLERYDVTVEGDAIYVGSQGALNVGELFNGISSGMLEALARLAKREEFAEGAVLYRPGDPAEDFFVLESGRVEFQIGRDERVDRAGFMLKKGEVFGWAALVDNQP
jgi:toluene monooxygenase system ferredoxin subunit